MLPGLEIKFDNGNAGTLNASPDGVFGLVAFATATSKFELATPYLITGMKDVATLKILPTLDNKLLYDTLLEFYTEAGDGTNLWLMGMPNDDIVSWFTPNEAGDVPITKLLDTANGSISCLIPKTGKSISNEQLLEVMSKANIFAGDYTRTKFAPFFTILDLSISNLNEMYSLPNLLEMSYNRVGVFIGQGHEQTGNIILGGNHILAGRLAKIQVHENAGKVRLGAVSNTKAFIAGHPIEEVNVGYLHDKGYITFRTHVRKSGYFFTDDPLATGYDDDYHYITRRRVIDKAYKIAYDIAIHEVLTDIDIMPDGTISPLYAKLVEGKIVKAIYNLMTVRGELSVDKSDDKNKGVRATMDLKRNVANTNRIEMTISVRPKGQNRYFDILLGYEPIKKQ